MDERLILGLTELIKIKSNSGEKINVIARIDTGATSSSIDINLAELLSLGPILTSKVVKSASGIEKRPIVKIEIILKNLKIKEEFTIADRGHLTYKILIGQNILKKGNFLIDPLKEEKEKDKKEETKENNQ